jgi:hypothetical protein
MAVMSCVWVGVFLSTPLRFYGHRGMLGGSRTIALQLGVVEIVNHPINSLCLCLNCSLRCPSHTQFPPNGTSPEREEADTICLDMYHRVLTFSKCKSALMRPVAASMPCQ